MRKTTWWVRIPCYVLVTYGGENIKGHMSSLADLLADAYRFTKVRSTLKSTVYSFQGLLSSKVPLLSRMRLRDPV